MYCRSYGTIFRFLYPKTKRKTLCLLTLLFVSCIAYFYFSNPLKSRQSDFFKKRKKQKHVYNHQESSQQKQTNNNNYNPGSGIESGAAEKPKLPSALVFTDSEKINGGKKSKLKTILQSLRINYDFIAWNRPEDNFLVIPRLTDTEGANRYHLIIFTSQHIFEHIDTYNGNILKEHCLQFRIGIIILTDITHIKGETRFHSFTTLPISIQSGVMYLKDLEVAHSSLLHITKPGNILKGTIHGKRHAIFYSNHSSFEPVAYALKSSPEVENILYEEKRGMFLNETWNPYKKSVSIIYDKGKFDGIRKVIFGTPVSNSWLHQLIFIDAISTLSNGILGYGIKRYIQIDIDDIFVGHTGHKLIRSDVKALLESQTQLALQIPGFKYYLGFSGKSYRNSNNSDERDGDKAFIDYSKEFRWFSHTFSHVKPHTLQKDDLVENMLQNKIFAVEKDIKLDEDYAVAPHHSGVYPTHDALYEAWKEVWGIKVTSTEGYPHLYPATGRKGFQYKDIMVLPRQTCGLFTGTLHIADYPKGPSWLERSANGGELFWSIIFNPIAIFMTHAGNFGNRERLAIQLFANLTRFIRTWTNVQLVSKKPIKLAQKYFTLFPKQLDPVWEDPCIDKRHQKIWNGTSQYCIDDTSRITRLPDFLILGPQKSGSTALFSFISMHPDVYRNRFTRRNFEELQYFNRNDYMKGLTWYLDFFPSKPKASGELFFEKSANYFDSSKAPMRVYSLIPNAKLIVLLIDPRKRAYSWYQHMLSKGDPIAQNHTFYEILTNQNKTDSERFVALQQRCLLPGLYAESLERWLQYFSASKIHIVDGYELRYEPRVAMEKISDFLGLAAFPFDKRIKFNNSKGFYCATSGNGKHKCLGKSKGRNYKSMTNQEMQYLTDFYRVPNLRLVDLLSKYQKDLPRWLAKETKDRDVEI